MKAIISIYILIGIILSPFIYRNDAIGYMQGVSTGTKYGMAIGESIYWPSFLFSIEPTIDSKDVNTFQNSIIEIIEYRNNKLFTGKRTYYYANIVSQSIDICLAVAAKVAVTSDTSSLLRFVMNANSSDKEIIEIRKILMDRFDGFDFADIVAEGEKCQSEWKNGNFSKRIDAAQKSEIKKSDEKVTENNSNKLQDGTKNNDDQLLEKDFHKMNNDSITYINECIESAKDKAIRYGGYTTKNVDKEYIEKYNVKEMCKTYISNINHCVKDEKNTLKACYEKYQSED